MTKKGKIQIYKSKSGAKSQRWRWRVVARNGNILADSGEGYLARSKCRRAIFWLKNTLSEYPIEEV